MPDLSNYEIARALREPGCPLCRVLAVDEERLVQQFWRDSRLLPPVRMTFLASGGFCRRHAWLMHDQVMKRAKGRGGALTELYDRMAARDLRRISEVTDDALEYPELVEGLRAWAQRSECQACIELAEATSRRAHFLCQLLREEGMVDAYRASEGLCLPHLHAAVRRSAEDDPELGRLLLTDWSERLAVLRAQLAEFDRKRDYRHADEPRGEEQRAPTDAVSRYAGEPPDA